MPSDGADSRERTWRRRERSWAAGVLFWALSISIVVAVAPTQLADLLLTADPVPIAGGIMLSIGLYAAFADTVHIAAQRYAREDDAEGIDTDWQAE